MSRAVKKPELVTDWIPCTTRPVRNGVYELDEADDVDAGIPITREFKGGRWVGGEGIDKHPHLWVWRGVRRWVLAQKATPILSAMARRPIDVYLISARPRCAKFGALVQARPFKTQAKAERFAARFAHLGLTAVLP